MWGRGDGGQLGLPLATSGTGGNNRKKQLMDPEGFSSLCMSSPSSLRLLCLPLPQPNCSINSIPAIGRLNLASKLLEWRIYPEHNCMSGAIPDDLLPKEHQPEEVLFKTVSCGEAHTVSLDTQSRVWVWGQCSQGQLGIGDVESSQLLVESPLRHFEVSSRNTPCLLHDSLFRNRNITYITAGGATTAAIDESHKLWMWGSNDYGCLAEDPRMVPERIRPAAVRAFRRESVTKVMFAKGMHRVVAVTGLGQVFSWGQELMGCGGIQFPPKYIAPPARMALHDFKPRRLEVGGDNVVDASAGLFHTLVLTGDVERKDSEDVSDSHDAISIYADNDDNDDVSSWLVPSISDIGLFQTPRAPIPPLIPHQLKPFAHTTIEPGIRKG